MFICKNQYYIISVYMNMAGKKISLFLFILFLGINQSKANDTLRYRDQVFNNLSITKNISYNDSANAADRESYLMDIYQPAADSGSKRPLIIWMHGGGFKFGSKEASGIRLWCKTFAERGYVCVAINYRLSKNNPLLHYNDLLKGCYDGVIDAKKAIRFFRENALKYGIDSNKIILAGNSAGGMIALQTAFVSNADLAKSAGLTTINGDDGSTSLPKIAAVVNLWGAIFNRDWLKNARVPIVSVLGDQDGIVAPTHKNTSIYGGEDIHSTADSLQLANALRIFKGYSHELQKHFNPLFPVSSDTEKRWLEAGQFVADFLYSHVIAIKDH